MPKEFCEVRKGGRDDGREGGKVRERERETKNLAFFNFFLLQMSRDSQGLVSLLVSMPSYLFLFWEDIALKNAHLKYNAPCWSYTSTKRMEKGYESTSFIKINK